MSTQRHEVEAWLGDARADLTAEQVDEMVRLVQAAEAAHPEWGQDPNDYAEESAAAWVAILERVAGTLDLAGAGREYVLLRAQTAHVWLGVQARIVQAVDAGMSQSEAARLAGVDRMTVRSVLGLR